MKDRPGRYGHIFSSLIADNVVHGAWIPGDPPQNHAASPLIGDPQRFIDDEVQFRHFYCPACGGLLENEVCRTHDPLLWDIELAVDG